MCFQQFTGFCRGWREDIENDGEESASSPTDDRPKRKDLSDGDTGEDEENVEDDADELVKSFMQSVNLLDLKEELKEDGEAA